MMVRGGGFRLFPPHRSSVASSHPPIIKRPTHCPSKHLCALNFTSLTIQLSPFPMQIDRNRIRCSMLR